MVHSLTLLQTVWLSSSQTLPLYNTSQYTDCTFSAHGLLALAQVLHHNSTLQEKKSLEELTVTVDGDNEAKDYAKLLVEYPYMVDNPGIIYLQCKNISDGGAVALAQALSTLKELYLSK